jgi:hypothetical protein
MKSMKEINTLGMNAIMEPQNVGAESNDFY